MADITVSGFGNCTWYGYGRIADVLTSFTVTGGSWTFNGDDSPDVFISRTAAAAQQAYTGIPSSITTEDTFRIGYDPNLGVCYWWWIPKGTDKFDQNLCADFTGEPTFDLSVVAAQCPYTPPDCYEPEEPVNPSELSAQAACYHCYGATLSQGMRIVLLSNIIQNISDMPTDTQTLLERGKCYACYGLSQGEIMEIALLDLVADVVASLAAGGVTCGNYAGGQPTFTPATACGVAIDTSNERIWWYYSGAWH